MASEGRPQFLIIYPPEDFKETNIMNICRHQKWLEPWDRPNLIDDRSQEWVSEYQTTSLFKSYNWLASCNYISWVFRRRSKWQIVWWEKQFINDKDIGWRGLTGLWQLDHRQTPPSCCQSSHNLETKILACNFLRNILTGTETKYWYAQPHTHNLLTVINQSRQGAPIILTDHNRRH